jgi:hypothetical protein
MTKLKMTTLAAALLGMGLGSSVALAGSDSVADADMSRISPDAASGDKVSTVRNNCGGGVEGWEDATAEIEISQKASGSEVEIEVTGAKPDTLFTVWVRMKGTAHGNTFGGSPITGGGATPLAHSSDLDQLVADWIGPGSPTAGNSFRTNADGEGEFEVDLDFPVVGGAYPFNRMSHQAHLDAQAKRRAGANDPTLVITPSPTAIVNPADAGVGPSGTPFLIRVISHCQDNLAHGLSPAKREAWFQYP